MSDKTSTSSSSQAGNGSAHRSMRNIVKNKHKPPDCNCQHDSDEPPSEGGPLPRKVQRIIALGYSAVYVIAFALLVAAAFFSQNLFLLSSVPIMARELAYMFHRMVDFLFPEK
jgi:hypothetical protein